MTPESREVVILDLTAVIEAEATARAIAFLYPGERYRTWQGLIR